MKNSRHSPRIAVIGIGGNALIGKGQRGTITEQFANSRKLLKGIVDIIKAGFMPVIVHGNGPQVGTAMIRVDMALDKAPEVPLGVLVADTEGSMGYMIGQSLINILRRQGLNKPVTTVLTQVIVDKKDPSLLNPTKPVGPFYSETEAQKHIKTRGWNMIEDAGRGWRRVVPSPYPLEIVEQDTIRLLIDNGVIVIAGGGGGIPVYVEDDNTLEGIDAVIDKDVTSAVLGNAIGAELMVILMGEPKVALRYGQPDQLLLGALTKAEASAYLEQGEFAEGSMAPKIRAAIKFLDEGGQKVIITDTNNLLPAFQDKAGTRIAG